MNPETVAWLKRAVLFYVDSVEDYGDGIQSFLATQWRAIVKLRVCATPEHSYRWLAHQRVGWGTDLIYSADPHPFHSEGVRV